jgi:two-component system response regulator YesN
MYNHRLTCEALTRGDPAATRKLAARQLAGLEAVAPSGSKVTADFLRNLNLSLYHGILYTLNLSLTDCLIDNERLLALPSPAGTLAERIIGAYDDALRGASLDARAVELASHYIRQHLDEALTLEHVASRVYTNKCYLCRMFKTVYGTTFLAYVTEQRIHRAKTLLGSTRQSVSAIATACGYSTAAYFSTIFKKETGVTPREYRRGAEGRGAGVLAGG